MIRKGLIFHAVFTLHIGQRLVLEPDNFPECRYLTIKFKHVKNLKNRVLYTKLRAYNELAFLEYLSLITLCYTCMYLAYLEL